VYIFVYVFVYIFVYIFLCPLLHHIGALVLKFLEKEKEQHCFKNNWFVKFIFSLLRVIIVWWIPIMSLFLLTYNSQLVDMLCASPWLWSFMLCSERSMVLTINTFETMQFSLLLSSTILWVLGNVHGVLNHSLCCKTFLFCDYFCIK